MESKTKGEQSTRSQTQISDPMFKISKLPKIISLTLLTYPSPASIYPSSFISYTGYTHYPFIGDEILTSVHKQSLRKFLIGSSTSSFV